jgi:hypothetical protein
MVGKTIQRRRMTPNAIPETKIDSLNRGSGPKREFKATNCSFHGRLKSNSGCILISHICPSKTSLTYETEKKEEKHNKIIFKQLTKENESNMYHFLFAGVAFL